MAWENTEYDTYNGLVGTTHAGERGQRAGGSRISGDFFTSEWGQKQKHWSLGLGSVGEVQGGGPDV